jgi:hypothetical protein
MTQVNIPEERLEEMADLFGCAKRKLPLLIWIFL